MNKYIKLIILSCIFLTNYAAEQVYTNSEESILNALFNKIQEKHPNRPDIIAFIIKAKSDIHAKYNGMNLFHFADDVGDLDSLKLLLSKGFNINSLDDYAQTPLMRASSIRGNLEIIKYLIENGASKDVKNKSGCDALMFAVMNNKIHVIEYLLGIGMDINTKDNNGFNLLHAASFHGLLETVKFLLNKGLNINSLTNDNRTPLMVASMKGHLGVVKYLIENGASKDVKNKSGCDALMLAAMNNKITVIEYLLSIGMDINTQDINGRNLLHSALGEGYLDLVKLLLENGVNIESLWNDKTPLMRASMCGHLEIVKYLIKNNANISAKMEGANILMLAVMNNRVHVVQYLLSIGFDINTKDDYGYNLLHSAANHGYLDMVKFLLSQGLNVNALTENNITSLLLAVKTKKISLIECLLNAGADISAKNDLGQNAIVFAAVSKKIDIIKYLISASMNMGIDLITKLDKKNAYPFEYYTRADFSKEIQQEILDAIEMGLYDDSDIKKENPKIKLHVDMFRSFDKTLREFFLLRLNIDVNTDIKEFGIKRANRLKVIDSGDIEEISKLSSLSLFFSKKQMLDLLIRKIKDKNYAFESLFVLLNMIDAEYWLTKLVDKYGRNILFYSLVNNRDDISMALIERYKDLMQDLNNFLGININESVESFNRVFAALYKKSIPLHKCYGGQEDKK